MAHATSCVTTTTRASSPAPCCTLEGKRQTPPFIPHSSSYSSLSSSRACRATGPCLLLLSCAAPAGSPTMALPPTNPTSGPTTCSSTSSSSSSSSSGISSITASAASVSQAPALQKQRQQKLQWRPVVYVVTSEEQEEEEESRALLGTHGAQGKLSSAAFTIPEVVRREVNTPQGRAKGTSPAPSSSLTAPAHAPLPAEGKPVLGAERQASRSIPPGKGMTGGGASGARAGGAWSKSGYRESRAAAASGATAGVSSSSPAWGVEGVEGVEGGVGSSSAGPRQRAVTATTEDPQDEAPAAVAAAASGSAKSGGFSGVRNTDSDLALSRALPLPMTTPEAKPMSLEQVEEQLNCDPEIQSCKEPVYEWTSVCTQCQGTGFYTPRSSSRRRRGKGSCSSSQGFKCITCCGLGAVFRYTVRDTIPVMEDVDRKKEW